MDWTFWAEEWAYNAIKKCKTLKNVVKLCQNHKKFLFFRFCVQKYNFEQILEIFWQILENLAQTCACNFWSSTFIMLLFYQLVMHLGCFFFPLSKVEKKPQQKNMIAHHCTWLYCTVHQYTALHMTLLYYTIHCPLFHCRVYALHYRDFREHRCTADFITSKWFQSSLLSALIEAFVIPVTAIKSLCEDRGWSWLMRCKIVKENLFHIKCWTKVLLKVLI